jgi:hypothetical protein
MILNAARAATAIVYQTSLVPEPPLRVALPLALALALPLAELDAPADPAFFFGEQFH